jgi:hypothetical protein
MADMNAQAIVDQFNSASGGTAMQFTFGWDNEVKLTQYSPSGFADTSAYLQGVTGGSDYYKTFCVQPNVGVTLNTEAKLSYINNGSKTTSGYYLTIGTAYLYSQFAAGTLTGYLYDSSNGVYQQQKYYENLLIALRMTMGIYNYEWDTNPFTSLLLETFGQSFWTQVYDPNQYYGIIGNYSVFVMNNREIGTGVNSQDFLYVAQASNSSDVPEPTTILLWGLGGLGALAARKKRKRSVTSHVLHSEPQV